LGSGVGDNDIHATELGLDIVVESLHILLLAHVDLLQVDLGLRADATDGLFHLLQL
jgi:hypothetical protein